MRHPFVSLALCLWASAVLGVNIAVIDSGVDYNHLDLKYAIWENPANPQDVIADGVKYPAATNGWNFSEWNNQIIDYKYLGSFSADCTKAIETQSKIAFGTATQGEKDWYKQKKKEAAFLAELTKFGTFVHGTHVSGIAAKGAPKAKIIGLKIIPTERSITRYADEYRALYGNRPADNVQIKLFLRVLAKQQGAAFVGYGKFVKATGARVANASFGISVALLKPTVGALVKQITGLDPSDDDKEDYARYMVGEVLMASAGFPAASPETIFVLAAGNEGIDNSSAPVSPANIKASNTITVAATNGTASLASFSNYSGTLVEVAAPGVGIDSAIPGDKYLAMSGTSMAAPFVANVAGLILDENPKLTSADVKTILMSTVDKKGFLYDLVSTSGIVNKARALAAARLSRSMALTPALARARAAVVDQPVSRSVSESAMGDLLVLPLPSPL